MLCTVIVGPSFNEALQQIEAYRDISDLFEFRLDFFEEGLDVAILKQRANRSVIFTLRPARQQGAFLGEEPQRLTRLKEYASLKPEYIDLEDDLEESFFYAFIQEFPQIKIIVSHHCKSMPEDLSALLFQMSKRAAFAYKIACFVESTVEALRLLVWLKQQKNCIAVGMGEKGLITRLMGPFMGSLWGYITAVKWQPGQIGKEEVKLYGLKRFKSAPQLFVLIGDPIEGSISHQTHNHFFQTAHREAIYVKLSLTSAQLFAFFKLAPLVGIRGCSVTMPLKEAVMTFMDRLDEGAAAIGAVNTVVCEKERWIGYNTDGKGALDAIEKHVPVKGKKVVVLGAGGAARAIIFEALARGAKVRLWNRSQARAEAVGTYFNIAWQVGTFTFVDHDILINSTPSEQPVAAEAIREGSVLMDIKVRKKRTGWQERAAMKKCTLVTGREMFANQALGQFQLWFGSPQ